MASDDIPKQEANMSDDPSQSKSHCPQHEQSAYVHHQGHDAVRGYLKASGLGPAVRAALTAVLREAQEDALQLASGAGFEATEGYRPRGWARYDPLVALAKHLLAAAAGHTDGGGGEGDGGGVAVGSSAAAAVADDKEEEPGQGHSGGSSNDSGNGSSTVSAAEGVKASDSGPAPHPPPAAAAEGAS